MHSGLGLRLRSNLKTPERCEPSIPKILLHRGCALNVLGVDDDYSFEALLRHEPSDFLPRPLEDRIISMHPMQVMIEEGNLELLLAQSPKCSFRVLGEDRMWHTLPKPRDAILRVLDDENRPVRPYMKLLACAFGWRGSIPVSSHSNLGA